jgi:hypothetical protein
VGRVALTTLRLYGRFVRRARTYVPWFYHLSRTDDAVLARDKNAFLFVKRDVEARIDVSIPFVPEVSCPNRAGAFTCRDPWGRSDVVFLIVDTANCLSPHALTEATISSGGGNVSMYQLSTFLPLLGFCLDYF